MRNTAVLLLTLILLAACAVGYPGLRKSNSDAMNLLTLGMPKSQVVEIMGGKGFGEFSNPARKEQFSLGNEVYEVLYYYTTFIQDGQPLDTGFTPVVLKNGRFAGSGREYLAKIR